MSSVVQRRTKDTRNVPRGSDSTKMLRNIPCIFVFTGGDDVAVGIDAHDTRRSAVERTEIANPLEEANRSVNRVRGSMFLRDDSFNKSNVLGVHGRVGLLDSRPVVLDCGNDREWDTMREAEVQHLVSAGGVLSGQHAVSHKSVSVSPSFNCSILDVVEHALGNSRTNLENLSGDVDFGRVNAYDHSVSKPTHVGPLVEKRCVRIHCDRPETYCLGEFEHGLDVPLEQRFTPGDVECWCQRAQSAEDHLDFLDRDFFSASCARDVISSAAETACRVARVVRVVHGEVRQDVVEIPSACANKILDGSFQKQS